MQKNYLEKSPLEKNKKITKFTRWILSCYFLLSFFEPYLNGAIGSVVKYYIFAVVIVEFLTAKTIKFRYYHTVYMTWFLYKIMSVFWTRNFTIFERHIMSQIGMLALLMCVTMIYTDLKTINWITNSMWLGSGMIGFLSLFLSKPYLFENQARQVLTLFGQQADPNNQAAFVVIGIAISLYYLLSLRKYRVLSIITILINTYSLFIVGSRGGFVAYIAIVATFLFLYFKSNDFKRKSFKKKLQATIIIFIVGLVVVYIANNLLQQATFNRLFDFEDYAGGSKRTVLWATTWRLISEGVNFIFGAGWGAYYGYNGMYDVVHNTFLSILCDTGVIGLGAFLLPLIVSAVYLIKKRDPLAVSVLVAGMAPAFFIEAINKRFFWNSMIFLFIIYNFTIENRHILSEYNQNSAEGHE